MPIFLVTSADSTTVVLSILDSRGNPGPGRSMQLVWGLLVSLQLDGKEYDFTRSAAWLQRRT
ncbi:MAG TPA: BCCT family transporter, partial [Ottowia sp.]|nr:BCCT family transporter [Ottowia sp.]